MDEQITELISETAIRQRTNELAAVISQKYARKTLTMVCVLKGGVIFMVDLARKIADNVNVEFDFMGVSSYGDLTTSSDIKITKDLTVNLTNKNVLIVEDIVDSGRTLKFLTSHIESRNPNSVEICALLDKPERRRVPISAQYTGFVIPDEFVVGYGLDYAERYRTLPYIGTIKIENAIKEVQF